MDLGLKIKKINDLLEKNANQMLQKQDLTYSQHHVLIYLRRQENYTARLKELEKHFNVAQATMAGIVVRLESKGLVESSVLPEDRRVKVLTLTESGEKLLHESYMMMKEGEAKLISDLGEQETEELNRLLDMILKTIQEYDGKDITENRKENIC